MNQAIPDDILRVPDEFKYCFDRQQAAHKKLMNPTYEKRKADLRTLHRMVVENRDALVEAVNRDYGRRSRFETEFVEIFLTLDATLDAIKQLRKWMRPQRRHLPFSQYPMAKAWTFPQPVGVVGIIAPWNFPIATALHPLIGAFAAGNRAMIKMSENSAHVAALLKEISPRYFPLEKLAFFEDGNGRGPAFTSLPFDHIFFTGSSATGRAVMTNAARNLTPVTLELGGKAPCVVAPDYAIEVAAERIVWAKTLNAGQICVNVDYLLLPEGKVEAFIAAARKALKRMRPDVLNGDYTAIIDRRQYARIQHTLDDALAKGAEAINLCPEQTGDPARRILPPQALVNVNDDMIVMQNEIFGPLLPIKTYKTHQEVVDYINDRPRPLALYLYSNDKRLQDFYLNNSISGSVGLNECIVQGAVHSMPFGGTGNSGMGHYHGYEGFLTFSKLRPVFRQGPFRALDLFRPPYAGRATRLLNFLVRSKS